LRVKVCGITTYRDASIALDLGADALGFNFYPPSPRYINPDEARRIIGRLPPFATTVGVYVNADDFHEVERSSRYTRVEVLQLHGSETPEYCRELAHRRLIKTVRVGSGFRPQELEKFRVSAFLLDTWDPAQHGGTGKTFDWNLAATIRTHRPLILAGGLAAGNVADAIRTVHPYAVDVCSGVEIAPGKKDRRKLAAFMNEVHRASRDIDG
jgi:phosphoribosylanthranilate isomerase